MLINVSQDDYALKYRAGVPPPRPNGPKRVTEYQMQFKWRDRVGAVPMLAAEQAILPIYYVFILYCRLGGAHVQHKSRTFSFRKLPSCDEIQRIPEKFSGDLGSAECKLKYRLLELARLSWNAARHCEIQKQKC